MKEKYKNQVAQECAEYIKQNGYSQNMTQREIDQFEDGLKILDLLEE